MRREFSKAVKLAAWQRSGGNCEICSARLYPGRFRYDHRKPDTFGGEPTIENCVVQCDACDKTKTYGQDIPAIAKSSRVRAKFLGLKKPKSRPMFGTKRSGFKRKFNGSIEKR